MLKPAARVILLLSIVLATGLAVWSGRTSLRAPARAQKGAASASKPSRISEAVEPGFTAAGVGRGVQLDPQALAGAAGASAVLSAPVGARARLHALWTAEPSDPAWTEQATETLREAAGSAGVSVSMIDTVSCRQTVCRVELKITEPAALMALSRAAGGPHKVAFQLPGTRDMRYEVYVPRSGSRLAALFAGQGRHSAAQRGSDLIVAEPSP